MKELQATFPRSKRRLPSDKVMREMIIFSCVLLHNFRAENDEINEIRTVFDEEYERYISMENYDRIKRYFVH